MVFNSLEFALFLPLLLIAYYGVGDKHRNLVLLLAGYVFYGFWDPRFLYLVSVSTVLDYCTGLMIGQGQMTRRQRLAPSAHVLGFALVFLVFDWSAFSPPRGSHRSWLELMSPEVVARCFTPTAFGLKVLGATALVVALAHAAYPRLARLPEAARRLLFLRFSLFGQLGMLGVFKYYNFFIDSADTLAQRFGSSAAALHLDLVLPIGISFYTFQTLSYVCDVYYRRMEPVQRLRDFALFVSYFPPLVAGPIERASHLVPRILGERERRVTVDHFMQGGFLILVGLFKKVAIADGLAGSVNSVFESGNAASWIDIAGATLAFTLQIYCDFSGYSDIASGCSLFFGIDLLKNFDLPYFSVNPSDFWRRWHISLSSWLRDYLYIPLGGNRDGESKTRRNLMLTMVLGGLWHGAAWNFVLWGAYQGLLLVAHRMIKGASAPAFTGGLLARLPRMAFFMVFVCYGWLLFRATSFDQIVHFTRTLLIGPFGGAFTMKMPTTSALLAIPVLVGIEALQMALRTPLYHRRLSPPVRGGLYAMLTVLFLLGTSNEAQQFIYFQF